MPIKQQKTSLFSLGDVLKGRERQEVNKYVSREFQDYGYRLACEMGEETRKAMYIKMAKMVDRGILERARSFVIDAPEVRNKGRLFMWAVNKLKRGEPLQAKLLQNPTLKK
jgi:hypothetical protein